MKTPNNLKNAIQQLMDENPDVEYVEIEAQNIMVKFYSSEAPWSAQEFEPDSLTRIFLEDIFKACQIAYPKRTRGKVVDMPIITSTGKFTR